MFKYLLYIFNLIILKLFYTNNDQKNKYYDYDVRSKLSQPKKTGALTSDLSWDLACPDSERGETLTLVASNTFDKKALKLEIKWRPQKAENNQKLVTTSTKLTFESGNENFNFEQVETYSPNGSEMHGNRITQYGSSVSALKLYVILPYDRYRLVFNGNINGKLVKINALLINASVPFDFKNHYNRGYVAKQAAESKTAGGLTNIINALQHHDRHEYLVQIKGHFSVDDEQSKLFIWGFKAREMYDESAQPVTVTRLVAYFAAGKVLHFASMNGVQFGFEALGFSSIRPRPLEKYEAIMDKISASSHLEFDIRDFRIFANQRVNSTFYDSVTKDTLKGWIHLSQNENRDTPLEIAAFKASLEQYKSQLTQGLILAVNNSSSFEETRPLVVSITEDLFSRQDLVGAKAASLGQMQALADNTKDNSFSISPAIALTRFVYDELVSQFEDLKDSIRILSAKVGKGDLSSLGLDCERLQGMISNEHAKLPSAVIDAIKSQMKSAFKINDLDSLDKRLFAVRSSSWGEDEEGMSAAGQLTTCLDVAGMDGLIKAVKVCLASKFSLTNIEYKRQHGLPLDLPMAVVIQEMVACDKAGVMFTCDPASGNAGFYTITANYGLGESVVSAQADPDSIKVDVRDGHLKISEIKIGKKDVVIQSEKDVKADGDAHSTDKPASNSNKHDANVCCMSEKEILDLCKIGKVLVTYFGNYRDIEFGFKGDVLYLFQSRPVTSLDQLTDFEMLHELDTPTRSEVEFVSRANIGEVLPYAVSPLFVTYQMRHWSIVGRRLFESWGKADKKDCLLKAPEGIKIDSCHFFFSLQDSEMFRNSSSGNGKSLLAKAMEIGMFGHEVDNPELEAASKLHARKPSFWSHLIAEVSTYEYKLWPKRRTDATRRQLDQLRCDINANRYIKDHSLEELYKQIIKILDVMMDPWVDHYVVIFLASKANFILLMILSKYVKDPTELMAILSSILALAKDVLSAEIPARIEKMANIIKQRGREEADKFVQMDSKEALKYVTNDFRSELSKQFDEFMEKFGHRCYNEFELNSKTWKSRPEDIIEKLKQNCKSDIKVKNEKRSIDEILAPLKLGLIDKLLVRYYAIPSCHTYLETRERTKDGLVRYVDSSRKAVHMLGVALRQQNRIPDDDLVTFMTYDELEHLVAAPQPKLVMHALQRRRLFRKFKPEWRFDEITVGHEHFPLHMKENNELDASLVNAPKLSGTTASAGKTRGRACVVNSFEELHKVQAADILVVHSTDIAFSPIFPLIAGLVTEVGGIISHGAVVAREYGLPCVISVQDATKIIKDGEELVLDADNGCVLRVGLQQKLD